MEIEGTGLDALNFFSFCVEGIALKSLVIVDLGHFLEYPGLGIESILEDVRVVLREVAVVISQDIDV